jgi:hypothetical protein
MIIPRYSLRTILLITAFCAVIFLIVSQGIRGSPWAVGVSIGLLALVTAVLVQALGFFLVWLFSLVLRRGQSRHHAPQEGSSSRRA